MRNSFKILFIILLIISMGCSNESVFDPTLHDAQNEQLLRQTYKGSVDIYNPVYNTVPGTSTIHRDPQGITINYKTSGLISGNAYTLWIAVWNYPENCETPGSCNDPDFANFEEVQVEMMYGGGHVVGNGRNANFTSRINVGDTSGSINDIFGLPSFGGLQEGRTMASEVFVILKNHGPAVPGIVNEQIQTFAGGCEVDMVYYVEDALEVGQCSEIEFAIHSPVSK